MRAPTLSSLINAHSPPTIAAFADTLRVSRTTLYNWAASSDSVVPARWCARVAARLGVTPATLRPDLWNHVQVGARWRAVYAVAPTLTLAAQRLGVHRHTVQRWLYGYPMREAHVTLLAQHSGVDARALRATRGEGTP